MAYNPSSFNYTPMAADQFPARPAGFNYVPGTTGTGTASGGGSFSAQFTDFSKWLAQQGIDMFNLARADRNTQLAVTNAFRQQQADRENALQQQQVDQANAQQQFQNRLTEQAYNDQRLQNAGENVMKAVVAYPEYFDKKTPPPNPLFPTLSQEADKSAYFANNYPQLSPVRTWPNVGLSNILSK